MRSRVENGSRFIGVKGITKASAQVWHGDLNGCDDENSSMSDYHFIRHSWMNFVGNLEAHNAVQNALFGL